MSKCECGNNKNPKRYKCSKCEHRIHGKPKYAMKKEVIDSYKSVPCHDCGQRYEPHIMDFDHVRGEKKFSIGSSKISRSLEDLLNEIAKCDVVCSNCHRDRTYRRLNGKD